MIKQTERQFKNNLKKTYLLGKNDGWKSNFEELVKEIIEKVK